MSNLRATGFARPRTRKTNELRRKRILLLIAAAASEIAEEEVRSWPRDSPTEDFVIWAKDAIDLVRERHPDIEIGYSTFNRWCIHGLVPWAAHYPDDHHGGKPKYAIDPEAIPVYSHLSDIYGNG